MAAVLKRSLLGIEIGTGAVRAVLLQARGGEDRIIAAHEAPCPSTAGQAEALATVLAPILAHEQAATAACMVALPAGDFVFRHLTAPFDQDRKLRQILPLELEPSLATPAEEMVFDYRRLNAARRPRILAVALEKSRLAGLLEDLAGLRIEPEWVTVNGIGAALLLAGSPATAGSFVTADLRPDGASVAPVADGQVLTIRDLPAVLDTDPGRQAFIAMLRQTFQAVVTGDGQAFHPDRILLTGYGPHSVALESILTDRLGLIVERVDLRHLLDPLAAEKDIVDWKPGTMNAALALALGGRRGEPGVNLRQGDFAVKKFWTRHRRRLKRTGLLVAMVVVLAAADFGYSLYLKQRRVDLIGRQTLSLFRAVQPDATRVVDPVSQMRAAIEELQAATYIPGSQGSRPRAIDILDALSREIPAALDVELNKLVIGTDNLVVTGNTDTFNAVDEMKTRLEKNPMLREVTIAAANIDKQSNRVRFTLNIGRLEVGSWPSD